MWLQRALTCTLHLFLSQQETKHFTLESHLVDCLTIKFAIRFIIEFLVKSNVC